MKRRRTFPMPAAGETALCRFPDDLVARRPGPKKRPAIILRVSATPDRHGAYRVTVCYATSNLTRVHDWDLLVDEQHDHDALMRMGLACTTKFDLSELVTLPYTDEWFSVPEMTPFGWLPKLGEIPPSLVPRLSQAIAAGRTRRR